MRNIKMSQSELNFRREYMRFENTIKALGQFEGTVVNDKYTDLKRELDSYMNLLDNGKDVNKSKLQGMASRLKNLRGAGKSRSNQLYSFVDVIDVETGEVYEGAGYSAKMSGQISPHDITSFEAAVDSLRPTEYSQPSGATEFTEKYYTDVPQNYGYSPIDYSTAIIDDVWDWIHKKPPEGIVEEMEKRLVELEAKYSGKEGYEERLANLFEEYANKFDAIYHKHVTYDEIESMIDVIDFIDSQLDYSINGIMNEQFEEYEQW